MRTAIEVAVVVLATAFVVWRLRPDLVLTDTLPAGGDLSSHGWGPDFWRRAVWPSLTGWSWDWLAGFPAYTFYPVLPALGTALLDVVLPYGVALKLTIVSGIVALPAASWAFARAWRLPFPIAPLVAVGAVAFLFDRGTTGGGTIVSTVSGEHSHAISITLAVVTLGAFAFVVRDGRWRVATALLLAATLLAHPLGALFALTGVVAIVVVHLHAANGWRSVLGRVAPVVAVAGAIAGVWWIPFVAYRAEMTSPDLPRGATSDLLPFGAIAALLVVLAVAAVVLGWREGRRIAGALAIVLVIHSLLYVVLPRGQLHNVRLAPVVAWCLLALAAIGVGELVLLVAERVRGPSGERLVWGAPAVVLVLVLVVVSVDWRTPPFGTAGDRFEDASIATAFAGYQPNPQYPEYAALMRTMARLGRVRGCGRLAWSTDIRTTDFGTLSNDMAPYWTDGCIQTTTGLYYDSSATTPMIALTESLTGIVAPRFAPGLPYRGFDLDAGVERLRYLGVRYYAARTEPVIAAADQQPDLRPVARAGPWRVYEVEGHEVVVPLAAEPIVFALDGFSWSDGAIAYTEQAPEWDARVLVESGPETWDRLRTPALPDERPMDPVRVSRVRRTDSTLSFRVDRVGRPVLVKASWFPRWRAEGADGPYRAAGNLMVVVPRARTVRLEVTRTPVDWLALASLLGGLAGAGILFVHDHRRRVS